MGRLYEDEFPPPSRQWMEGRARRHGFFQGVLVTLSIVIILAVAIVAALMFVTHR